MSNIRDNLIKDVTREYLDARNEVKYAKEEYDEKVARVEGRLDYLYKYVTIGTDERLISEQEHHCMEGVNDLRRAKEKYDEVIARVSRLRKAFDDVAVEYIYIVAPEGWPSDNDENED